MAIVNILSPVMYFCTILKLGNKLYNWISTGILTKIQIYIQAFCEGFHGDVIFFTLDETFKFR